MGSEIKSQGGNVEAFWGKKVTFFFLLFFFEDLSHASGKPFWGQKKPPKKHNKNVFLGILRSRSVRGSGEGVSEWVSVGQDLQAKFQSWSRL